MSESDSNPFTKPKMITGLAFGIILLGFAVSGGLELIFQFIPVSKILAYPIWMAWGGIGMGILWGSALVFEYLEFRRKQE